MNDRHRFLWLLPTLAFVLALSLGACAPRATSDTTLPLRYLASKDALFDFIVRETPRRYIVVNPYQGQFELVSQNRELGVVSLAFEMQDLYGPARQSATFQLFVDQGGSTSVVAAAATTSRLGYPLLAEELVAQTVTLLDQRYGRLR
jgi:hypothetical protein